MIHDVLFKKIMNLLIYFFSKVELHCNGYIYIKKNQGLRAIATQLLAQPEG